MNDVQRCTRRHRPSRISCGHDGRYARGIGRRRSRSRASGAERRAAGIGAAGDGGARAARRGAAHGNRSAAGAEPHRSADHHRPGQGVISARTRRWAPRRRALRRRRRFLHGGIDPPAFIAAVAAGVLPVKDPDYVGVLGLTPPLRSKPLVVAVQGGTQFAGHEYFLAADLRVAASDTVFRQAEVTRGSFPGGGATVRFPREAGWANAMRYMLTGDAWDAAEARRMGLVHEVTEPRKQ